MTAPRLQTLAIISGLMLADSGPLAAAEAAATRPGQSPPAPDLTNVS